MRVAILNDEKERVAIEAAVNQRLADVASIINASNVDQVSTCDSYGDLLLRKDTLYLVRNVCAADASTRNSVEI